jgi:hypothetical protein
MRQLRSTSGRRDPKRCSKPLRQPTGRSVGTSVASHTDRPYERSHLADLAPRRSVSGTGQADVAGSGQYVRGRPLSKGRVRVSDAEHVEAQKRQAATEADAGAVPDKPSRAHRLMHVLGAVLVAVVLPAVLMGALVGSLGVSAMFMGLVLGVVGSKIGGTHRMLSVAPLIGVAAGLGAFTAYDWWWAALLGGWVSSPVRGSGSGGLPRC